MSRVTTGDQLDAEAQALETLYNNAKPDHAPELEWFGMTLDHDTGNEQFMLEAERYLDSDGITALREAGWEIQYVEAHSHEFDEDVVVSICLPVRGVVPDSGFTVDTEQRGDRHDQSTNNDHIDTTEPGGDNA